MNNISKESFKGQRSKEKHELFKRFRHPAIADAYKDKFFALFNYRCFKCGVKEKPYPEFGAPPVLCIDHHIPMILGGHLIPGNLVALCQSCNHKKLDRHPKEFYEPGELKRLELLFDKQKELFCCFNFDWDHWDRDKGGYLLSLGVDPDLVHELLNNPDHRYYIEQRTSGTRLTIGCANGNIVIG